MSDRSRSFPAQATDPSRAFPAQAADPSRAFPAQAADPSRAFPVQSGVVGITGTSPLTVGPTHPLPTPPIYTPSLPTRATLAPTRPPTSPPTTITTQSPSAPPTPSPTTRTTPSPTTTPTTSTTTTTTTSTTTTTTPSPTTTPTTSSTTRTTTRPTTQPTRTTTAFSVNQLICTVSETAVFQQMVPMDGLCHYVYYTNMMVMKGVLTPVKVTVSWNMFKSALRKFNKTTGGVGFDVRYVSETDLQVEVGDQLNELSSGNVKHSGILNVLAPSTKLMDLFKKAKRLLSRLKILQIRDFSRKTLLALGIYNYLGANAWENLQEVFASAVDEAVADTVIAYSSVGWIERRSECFSHPPSIFNISKYTGEARKYARRAPDIFTVSRMMARDKRYKTNIKIGLSFELGTLIYEMKNKSVAIDMVNAACHALYVASLDAVLLIVTQRFQLPILNASSCMILLAPSVESPARSTQLRGEIFQGVNVAEFKNHPATIMFFEDENSIKEKCRQLALQSTNLRFGMALLLVNAHLGDFSTNSSCAEFGEKDRKDPFWRIKVIKAELDIL
ncbi:hypothetical protein MTO96_024397 [Rhipicephalus appendiculatus]